MLFLYLAKYTSEFKVRKLIPFFSTYTLYFTPSVDSNTDSNLWRKPLAEHWRKFVESYKGNKLSLYSAPGVDYNVLKLRHTVEEQYGAMIYTYIELFGSDELEDFVQPKKFKLNKKYQAILESERLRKELENNAD